MKPKSYLLPEQRRDKSKSLCEIKVTFNIDRIGEMTIDELKAVRSHVDAEIEKRTEHERLHSELLEIIESNGNLSNVILADTIIECGWRPTEGK